ncbi:MAG: ATP-binding protein [Pseudomonadota bacterium]|nr:ATP-binding protein [Pseudomonadota bacterium]
MSLKRQLFLASLLMLLIPWAGLAFVLELDSALRQQALEQLDERGERMARLAGDVLLGQPPVRHDHAVYVRQASQPIQPDGYASDWPGFDDPEAEQPWQSSQTNPNNEQPNLHWQAATDGQDLFLLVQMRRQPLAFFDPANPDQPHDRFELILQPPANQLAGPVGEQRWFIRTSAPGEVRATRDNRQQALDYRIHGFWRDTGSGWQLELKLPLPAQGSSLGFRAIRTGHENQSLGTDWAPPPPLVRRHLGLERALAQELAPGQQVLITEPAGWLIGVAEHADEQQPPDFDSLSPLEILERTVLNGLRWLIRVYQPEPTLMPTRGDRLVTGNLPEHGLIRHPGGDISLATEQPLFAGRTLRQEQSLDQLLTVSGSALGSVLARSLLIILALMLVLLGYASWLSWRIARLQRIVSHSVDADGRLQGTVPPARSRDELGQLQQHFHQMVERLQSYNHYLESFSRRLSHELKTPVAVVRSSLENLSHSASDDERQIYLDRAAQAAERLRRILHSMSEAARLEQSFDQTEREVFDLADVVREATGAYQQLDPDHTIRYAGPEHGCQVQGSPEMLVQMLDKLVDNARDFTPSGGLIEVHLAAETNGYQLSVFNEGSRLPDGPGVDVFAPFVSGRSGTSEGHLGQGLVIVKLIADFHGGSVSAANERRHGVDGVCMRVLIPPA